MIRIPLLCAFASLVLSAPSASAAAAAADWRASEGSRLGFEASAQGEAFQGGFSRFEARIRFDPDALADSRFEVDIELASVDSRNVERDEMLADPAFFDSASQPQARYIAETFVRLEDGRFRAEGELSLRGVTRPVPLVFSWWREEGRAMLKGEAVLNRIDFGVGSGEWEDANAIAHEVRVVTGLELSAAAPAAP